MCKERLRELGQLSLKKQRLMGNLTSIYELLKGGCKEERARIFSVIPRKRAKGNGNKSIKFHRTTTKNVYHECACTEQVAWRDCGIYMWRCKKKKKLDIILGESLQLTLLWVE